MWSQYVQFRVRSALLCVTLEPRNGCRSLNLTNSKKISFQAQGLGCEKSDVRPIKLNTLISEILDCSISCDIRQCRPHTLNHVYKVA